MTDQELIERGQAARRSELSREVPAAELSVGDNRGIQLPADPVAAALRTVLEHRQFAGGDLDECARGLGVDVDWLTSITSGSRPTLDATDLATACEALQCTPFALWPPDVARQTLDAYPPERWPPRTAPLEDLLTGDDTFVARRLEQQTAEIVSLGAVPQRLEPTYVTVTPYHIDGAIAVHEATGAIVTDLPLHHPAFGEYDYFFTFGQVSQQESVVAYLPGGVLEDAPPPGAVAPPDLVRIANDLSARTSGIDAVKVCDATGTVHWIGRAPGTAVWESWSDPAGDFPGDRDLVIRGPDALRFGNDLVLAGSVIDSGAVNGPELDEV